ncbi:UNVERIFIED_CONTAM: hypothetical protein GTU68_029028 [Idotea baltica]|nr:hypothetical protein [Idotea baltica]
MLVHGDAKAFACELCDKTFKRRDQLRSHIYYRHSNNRVYSCPVCYKTSHSTYHFKMHMLTHSNVRPFR